MRYALGSARIASTGLGSDAGLAARRMMTETRQVIYSGLATRHGPRNQRPLVSSQASRNGAANEKPCTKSNALTARRVLAWEESPPIASLSTILTLWRIERRTSVVVSRSSSSFFGIIV